MSELYWAAGDGDLDKVKRLIRSGADVEERGSSGKIFLYVFGGRVIGFFVSPRIG